MRKQTKFAAAVSVAALLALGASMTSMAATGWVEEGGEWFFYGRDGSKVEDTWKKSGDTWYWLDSELDGAMASDKLVEDGNALYYVDTTGAMVTNTWVKIVNEDQDDEDDPAEYNFYYMQGNGKAYKASGANTKFQLIDRKKYAFDEDGKMLYGWVGGDAVRLTGEDDWATPAEDVYYCGNWDDGSMKVGWQRIGVHDDIEDEDMEHWFWFKINGKRFYNDSTDSNIKEKKVNGKRYGFDARGVMVYEWTLATGSAETGSTASVSSWKYFNSPEDGARQTKGWFKVIPPTEDNSFGNVIDNIGSKQDPNTFDYSKADDESAKWYYADGDGNLKANQVVKIDGEYYGFAPTGYMLSGLVFMSVDDDGTILKLYDDSIDEDDLKDMMNDEGDYADFSDAAAGMYYFGGNEDIDGVMATGNVSIDVEGERYTFKFRKTGAVGSKGKGLTGIEDRSTIYKYGKKLVAGKDDKLSLVMATGKTSDENVMVRELDSADFRGDAIFASDANKKEERVKYMAGFPDDIYLINTSGTIVKQKTAGKDGADWYFYVYGSNVKMYTNNKTLPDSLKDWKDFPTPEV